MSRIFEERRKQLSKFKEVWDRLQQRPAQGYQTTEIMTCPACGEDGLAADVADALYTCPACGALMDMPAQARVDQLLDPGSFRETQPRFKSLDPLGFPGYRKKLVQAQGSTGRKDALLAGTGTIGGVKVALAILDKAFMMGTMGSVVGERLAYVVEVAIKKKLPLVMVVASGGARMQEGMISLMQMTKTAQALRLHHEAGLFSLCLMTNPTTGGVTASFASLADLILAEPGALIGFAGPRVIKDTVKEDLPPGFQSAEFQVDQGQVDGIVARQDQAREIAWWVHVHKEGRKR